MEIDATGRTVISVLNEMVRRAPSHAWFIVSSNDTEPRVLRVGFVNADGDIDQAVIGSGF
ncbi:MAG: hypothetical protein KA756_14100 [Steroidobacteraceae bacterium]|nr:hypothetical protein [Steroidobacteraceae bacterium]